MNARRVAFLLAALAPLAAACDGAGPRIAGVMPWSATVSGGRPWTSAADLTGDGRSELIVQFRWPATVRDEMSGLLLLTGEGATIDQVNFEGQVLEPRFLDVDGDGASEILAPVLRRDSLFLAIADGTGSKRGTFLLTTGRPRVESDGVLAWDPRITGHYLVDFDRDGVRDLVSVVVTGYARSPRGVLVHRLRDGVLLDSLLLGATLQEPTLHDPGGGRSPELFISTFATNNGAEAGGFLDDRGYLLTVGLRDSLRVTWSKELDLTWGNASGRFGDFDGDGDLEVVTFAGRSESTTRLEILEPPDWRSVRRADFAGRFDALSVLDLDRDAADEIVALEGGDELWALDGDLEVLRRRPIPPGLGPIDIGRDVDGDGVDEIFVRRRDRIVWLDNELRQNAVIEIRNPIIQPMVQYVHRGQGMLPALLIRTQNASELVDLARNPAYRMLRAGFGLAAILMPLAGAAWVQGRRRAGRARSSLVRALAEADGSILGVVDSRGRALWTTPRGGRMLGALGDVGSDLEPGVDTIRVRRPGNGDAPELTLIRLDAPETDLWLVRDGSTEASREAERAKAWPLVARRVAHDVKNPLTSILLTLQRLQVEYRDRVPDLAPDLDRYAARIEARVEHVRLLTSNFLKLTSPDRPELEPVDLHPLVARMVERLGRELPADVRLRSRLEEGPAWVLGDGEQIVSAVGNLVANGVDAMPEGGVVTLVLRGVPAVAGQCPRAMAIEVRDTGTGIPPEARDCMFQPGYSTRAGGWGIGLTLVRAIVDTHGASLEIESEVGVGTVVTITFPATAPPDGSDP